MNKKPIISVIFVIFVVFSLSAQNDVAAGTDPGMLAPEIEMQNPNGKFIKLSSLRGYIVLVDFWASWCYHCRVENPNIVNAYKTYSKMKFIDAKGFVIFSVSLDKNEIAWKTAIEDDGLVWKYHVSDLKGWKNSAAQLYGVSTIPANFLLDRNGIIIAKNLRGKDLLLELEKLVQY